MSIKDLKWDSTGERIDKRLIDEYARRTTEVVLDPYKRVVFVSHPADALTYYLYQKFPLIKEDQKALFLNVPGEATFKYQDGKVIEEESDVRKEKFSNFIEIIKEDNNKAETLADYIRQSVEEDSYADNFSNYFY